MNSLLLAVFLITASMNAAAQLLLKKGALTLGGTLSGGEPLLVKFARIVTNPFVVASVLLLGAGMLLWLKVISKVELSRAYPVNIALTVIITTIVSILLFNESATWEKFAGIALILLGIWITT